ncbi:hypothetical protein Pelo_15301 [Pelomyxa schiedti]|nr:hypothetical protein Pelo_15301 [Pelomyxa schiedti]
MFSAVQINNVTYARSQFIALGVGVIVGRCGRSSSVTTLTPSSLSHIGREWVVFPARHVVIGAAVDFAQSGTKPRGLLRFSVSPTLGVVGEPATIDIGEFGGVGNDFLGWVGPLSHNGVPRFALALGGGRKLSVVDTEGRVCTKMIGAAQCPYGCHIYTSWRWVVLIQSWWSRAISLWDCAGIEGGIVTSVENIALPDCLCRVAFNGDGTLIVSLEDHVIAIDLEATFAQKRLVSSPVPTCASEVHFEGYIENVICWKGMTYVIPFSEKKGFLMCLGTGQRTPLPEGTAEAKPIGGPYFVVTRAEGPSGTCVYSVVEPAKVLFRHQHGAIEVIDAVSGFVVFKLEKRGLSVSKPSSDFLKFPEQEQKTSEVSKNRLFESMAGKPRNRLTIRDATYARDQFIALGVGVIVGRCGRDVGSPVSALSSSTLALIGQNWVVVRSRLVVLALKRVRCHECHEVSVSPTLGLLTHPVFDEKISQAAEFHGWVGDHDFGERFALVNLRGPFGPYQACVIDTRGDIGDVIISEPPRYPEYRLYASRRWAVGIRKLLSSLSTMTLWSFADIESGSMPQGETIFVSYVINCAAFDGEGSLVVSLEGGGAMAIDLEATLAQRMLVSTQLPTTEALQSQMRIDSIICWKGMIYALLFAEEAGLQCLNTGQRITLCEGRAQPIGGPYFIIKKSTMDGDLADVRSVEEPTKVLCTHKKGTATTWCFGNGMVVKDTSVSSLFLPSGIEVLDAVSGFIIFRMEKGLFQVKSIS